MPMQRTLLSTSAVCAVFLLTAYSNPDSRATLSAQAAKAGNPITGEGLPNPAPKVTRNWGELPAGRKWGTSAGLDIDPKRSTSVSWIKVKSEAVTTSFAVFSHTSTITWSFVVAM